MQTNSLCLKEVLDQLTGESWYTLKKIPLSEKVSIINDNGEYFIIYFVNTNIDPVVCSKVSRSSFKKYEKKYRVH